jgi:hypothetical protein
MTHHDLDFPGHGPAFALSSRGACLKSCLYVDCLQTDRPQPDPHANQGYLEEKHVY